MTGEVYFDNNATTHLSVEARDAMCLAVMERFGNPSSEHRSGEKSRRAIAMARAEVAALLHSPAENIVFGSGVTELNNWVISSVLRQSPAKHLIISEVEHSSVLEAARNAESNGIRVSRIPVDREGLVDIDLLLKSLKSPTSLVSVQWVNNETGVIQPIAEIARACNRVGSLFHCDAAQAAGKLGIDLSAANIDFATVSAHKMHGPAGVGALMLRNRSKLAPLLFGGGQEFGLRPGTENVLGIIGFGAAAEARARKLSKSIEIVGEIRDRFEAKVRSAEPNVQINGSTICRVCNTTNLLFPDLDGAAIVALLDKQGIRCSQTSACTSSRPEPSHVLLALGLTESEAFSSVRFSFSDQNTLVEVDYTVTKLLSAIDRLRGFASRGGQTCQEGIVKNEV